MSTVKFSRIRHCPACKGTISSAELIPVYEPVPVFACPSCGALLWKPGLERSDEGEIFVFDPDADVEGL